MKNLLFITQHLPYPPYSGARRREYELLKNIAKKYRIYLYAVSNTFSEDDSNKNKIDIDGIVIELFKANSKRDLDYLNSKNIVAQIHRNNVVSAKNRIEELLKKEKIDIIHIEGFYMFPLLPPDYTQPVLLVEQNIEFTIWEQQAKLYPEQQDKYNYQSELTKFSEIEIWKKVDKLITVTDDDKAIAEKYVCNKDIEIVTNGFDHTTKTIKGNEPDIKIDKNYYNLLYIGNFEYKPNEDAALFFSKSILPKIQNQISNVRVYFVGNIGCSCVKDLNNNSNIYVTGRISDLSFLYSHCDIFICPLRLGGGIKTKILEAINHKKAIVTTSIGVQGIKQSLNSPLSIADSPDAFCKEVIRLLSDKEYKEIKEQYCNDFIKDWVTWKEAANTLTTSYENLIR